MLGFACAGSSQTCGPVCFMDLKHENHLLSFERNELKRKYIFIWLISLFVQCGPLGGFLKVGCSRHFSFTLATQHFALSCSDLP